MVMFRNSPNNEEYTEIIISIDKLVVDETTITTSTVTGTNSAIIINDYLLS